MADSEREDFFEKATKMGWSDRGDKPNAKGYIKLFCSCGKHITWIAKTPSNPHFYRERFNFMTNKCPGQ